jgi:serine/threonine protein kinase
MEEAFFKNSRVDAIAMDRLTASKHIVSMYSFCGMSVVTEFAGKELSQVVHKLDPTQRLTMGLNVAQGVADIHNEFLVHNDINLSNLVLTQDNRPVLNDFNIAIMLMQHNETGETCAFESLYPNSQWRSPEEQVLSRKRPVVTEKIDIYALGNVFYRLAVGTSPWKLMRSNGVLTPEDIILVAHLKGRNGTLPQIPEKVRQSKDPATQALLQAMYLAYEFDSAKRPAASFFVKYLQQSLESIQSQ